MLLGMNMILKFIIVVIITIAVSCQQGSEGLLELDAIVIDNPRFITKKAFNQLVSYDAILIGELHGTNECADLVYGIVKKFAANDVRVLVGFELP